MNRLLEGLDDFLETNTTSNVPANLSGSHKEEEDEDDDEEKVDNFLEELIRHYVNNAETDDAINEISYNEFANDDTKTDRQKVNKNIKKVKSKLVEIERLLTHAAKLKGTLSSDQKVFWKSTFNTMKDIRQRINKINKMAIEISK